MKDKSSNYSSKKANIHGVVEYTPEENEVWKELYRRQNIIIQKRACDEYIKGLEMLNLSQDRVPQCQEVSEILHKATGWVLEPVPALISFDHFFNLLAQKKFPAATFIRRPEDLDYIKEPDIFHEVFGHCPLLTNPAYAEFTRIYGELGSHANHQERILLARIFWFTIEFGLINTNHGLRAYGGGILSSINETVYCLESNLPKRKPFNVIEALETAYRIDVLQPIYFIIDGFDQLYRLMEMDLLALVRNATHRNTQDPKHPC